MKLSPFFRNNKSSVYSYAGVIGQDLSRQIMAACVALFIATSVLDFLHLVRRNEVVAFLGLSATGIARYRIWQLFTAPFLHVSPTHLIFNMFMLWMLGPDVERTLGLRRYAWFSLVCGLAASVGFLALNWNQPVVGFGYSGVIFGILTAQALLFPNRTIHFYGIIPLKMKRAVMLFAAIELYFLLSGERVEIGHSAHLCGAAAAWLYLRICTRRARLYGRSSENDGQALWGSFMALPAKSRGELRLPKKWIIRGDPRLLVVLVVTGLALITEGSVWLSQLYARFSRPMVAYNSSILDGIAVSFNGLQDRIKTASALPRMRLRGVLVDAPHSDWIAFGDNDPKRPELSLDALILAIRATQIEVDAPGIDIRPDSANDRFQEVRYFGGVGPTIVGSWFYRFDYWMKLYSLGETLAIPGIPVYWQRATAQLVRDVEMSAANSVPRSTANRFWLCTGEFKAVESGSVLAFNETPLQVLAEKYSDAVTINDGSSPCASKGTDDAIAVEFTSSVTRHLPELADSLPVNEIEIFAQFMAGISWLRQVDPYYQLDRWLTANTTYIENPHRVHALTRTDSREHIVGPSGQPIVHRHTLRLTGGVLVSPKLKLSTGNTALAELRTAIMRARPSGNPSSWPFVFRPERS